jgi:hypothetical protein
VLFFVVLRYDPRPWYFLPFLAILVLACDLRSAPLREVSPASGSREDPEGAADPTAAPVPRRQAIVRLVRAVGCVAVAAFAWPLAFSAAQVRQTNIDTLAEIVREEAAPGDLVLVNPWSCGVSFARYYRGAAAWTTLPPIADHRFHRYDLLKAQMSAEQPLAGLLLALDQTLASGHRIFLVGGVHLERAAKPVAPLPPAPGSKWGWFDVPYTENWSRQVGAFLAARAAVWQGIRLQGGDPVNPYERLPLLIAWGRRPLAAAPAPAAKGH